MNQTENNRPLVDGVPALERKLKEVREAQAQFATFSQEQVDQINHELGYDLPLLQRYFKWLGDALHGDFGS